MTAIGKRLTDPLKDPLYGLLCWLVTTTSDKHTVVYESNIVYVDPLDADERELGQIEATVRISAEILLIVPALISLAISDLPLLGETVRLAILTVGLLSALAFVMAKFDMPTVKRLEVADD